MSRRTVWEPPRVKRQRLREMYERLAVNAEGHGDDEHAAMFRRWAAEVALEWRFRGLVRR